MRRFGRRSGLELGVGRRLRGVANERGMAVVVYYDDRGRHETAREQGKVRKPEHVNISFLAVNRSTPHSHP